MRYESCGRKAPSVLGLLIVMMAICPWVRSVTMPSGSGVPIAMSNFSRRGNG